MKEDKTEKHTYSRRMVIPALASVLMGTASFGKRDHFTPSQPRIETTPSPQPTIVPPIGSPGYSDYIVQSLVATATATHEEKKTSTFEPQDQFTNDFFTKIRQSTFVIEYITDGPLITGTAWLIERDLNHLTVATCGHIFTPEGHLLPGKEISLWRPNIDEKKQTFNNFLATSTVYPDNGILKLFGDFQTTTPLIPLSFKDKYIPQEKEKFLLVGFPWEFIEPIRTITLAEIINSDYPIPNDNSRYGWFASGIVDRANSGSPIARINSEGNIEIVAMVSGGGYLTQASPNAPKHPLLWAAQLNLAPLLQDLR